MMPIFRIVLVFAAVLLPLAAYSQTPSLEPGVSHELAKWRAEHYSDVRYKLNLTLEKMSPVLKGTIEIRVVVRDNETRGSTDTASNSIATEYVTPIILDWRKIKGHEKDSTITNVTINGTRISTTPSAEAASTPPYQGGEFLESNEHLVFRDGVVPGENVIKLDFTSPILTSGSAITRYIDKEDGSEYIYSLFVPSDASTAFPVFDQPDLKARFLLQMECPGEWKFVSNANNECSSGLEITNAEVTQISETAPRRLVNTDGSNVLRNLDLDKFAKGCGLSASNLNRAYAEFFETKPISTYVFAFAAGPFERFQAASESTTASPRKVKNKLADIHKSDVSEPPASAGGRSVRPNWPAANATGSDKTAPQTSIYVRRSQAAKFKPHAAEVFRLNREAVKFFEEYFDYKFPFPKYDIVLIPEFPFGGMEHAGATFLKESSVIFPQEPTKNDEISRALLIFHETAHQWFGDTVTMRWFDDLWLKEGFANFMAYKALEKIMPNANAWKIFYERVKQAAYRTDSTKGTTPIYQKIDNLSAAKSAYGNIVYNKAPAFLRQAEFYIGEDKFQTAVSSFLKKHEYANATWEDLVKEFEIANGKEILRTGTLTEDQKSNIKTYERSIGTDLTSWAEKWVAEPEVLRIRLGEKWPNDRRQLYGYFSEKNSEGEHVCRPMKFRLFVRFDRDKRRITDVRTACDPILYDSKKIYTEAVNGITLDPKKKFGEPLLIFPNYGDYGYGIFLLDNKSREYVLKNIQNEKDPFLRSMMWGALWDSVREGELDPKVYVTLAYTILSREEDESIIAMVMNRVITAYNYYLDDGARVAVIHPLEDMIEKEMRSGQRLDKRITYYRSYIRIASTMHAHEKLKKLLRGKFWPDRQSMGGLLVGSSGEIPLKTKDKFDIVTRLIILRDPEALKLLEQLEKTETSDDAKRYAYAARAGFATAANKAKYWNDFVNNKDISESWIEAALGPWNSLRQSELTLPYLERALHELPNHKRSRKIFFVNGWLGAFLGGQRSEEALNIINKFLADNPKVDNDLRLKILENADTIERAVKIRAKFAN